MPVIFEHPEALLHAQGVQLGTTDWLLVDEARIQLFAQATLAPAGGTAPPFLALSLVNYFLPQLLIVRAVRMGVNVGCGRVRFPAALPSGANVRGSAEIVEVSRERDGIQAVVRVRIEVADAAEPACIAETISRFYPEP